MSNGAGQSLAKTFALPQRGQPNAGQQLSAGQFGGAPQLPGPADNLIAVEDATTSYFEKFGQLQSFAQGLWHNSGIDVTKPDFSDPDAIKAHTLYRKALADLQFQGVDLQNKQKAFQQAAGQSFSDPNVVVGEDAFQGSQEDILKRITNIGLQDRVDEKNQQFSKTFFTQKETDAANTELQSLRGDLQAEFFDAMERGDEGEAQTLMANIQSIGQASFDPNKILDRQQRERAAKGRGKQPIIIKRNESIAATQGGNDSELLSYIDPKTGEPVFSSVERIMSDDGVVMVLRGERGDGTIFTREIPITESNQGGRLAFNQLSNKFGSEAAQVSISDLDDLGRADVVIPPIFDSEGNLLARVTEDVSKNYIKGRNRVISIFSGAESQLVEQEDPETGRPIIQDKFKNSEVIEFINRMASSNDMIMPGGVQSEDSDAPSFDGDRITNIEFRKKGSGITGGLLTKSGNNRDRIIINFEGIDGSETTVLFTDNKNHMEEVKRVLDRNTSLLFTAFEEIGNEQSTEGGVLKFLNQSRPTGGDNVQEGQIDFEELLK